MKLIASEWEHGEDIKEEYCREYNEFMGCTTEEDKLHPNELVPVRNAGMRTLGKGMVVSLWGKLGERQDKKTTKYVWSSDELVEYYACKEKMKKFTVDIMSDNVVRVEQTANLDYLDEVGNGTTNIWVAAFTTAWGRLRLYELLEQVGDRVLYCDTDSCVYVSRPGEHDIALGKHLGEPTDEVKAGDSITQFRSIGCKSYAYKTRLGHEDVKMKGVTLNIGNKSIVNFDSFHKLVIKETDKLLTQPQSTIRRNRNFKLQNIEGDCMSVQYTFDKRSVLPDYDSIPFGFR
jgi:hypothetical protein